MAGDRRIGAIVSREVHVRNLLLHAPPVGPDLLYDPVLHRSGTGRRHDVGAAFPIRSRRQHTALVPALKQERSFPFTPQIQRTQRLEWLCPGGFGERRKLESGFSPFVLIRVIRG